MPATDKPFAIVNDVKSELYAVALCDAWGYDVWGDGEGGYTVNDRFPLGTSYRFLARAHFSNVPRYPGVRDPYRGFPNSPSFEVRMLISFEVVLRPSKRLKEKYDVYDVEDLFGAIFHLETDEDGEFLYVSDGERPIGELRIVGWESV